MTHLLPIGALCHLRDPNGTASETFILVTAHCTQRIAQVRLLSGDLAMATGTQSLLPGTANGHCGDLLVHAWPAYVPTADLHPTGALVNPADLQPAPVDPTLEEVVAPTDLRWAWELGELDRIQSHQCRVSLPELLGETGV